MNRKMTFAMLAAILLLSTAACSNSNAAWDNYTWGYQNAGNQSVNADALQEMN
jgi:hypothetical protein